MYIEVNDEVAALRRSIRRFVENELPRWAAEVDRTGSFPSGLMKLMGEQGLLGIRLPEEYGGANAGLAHYCMIQEELSRCHPMFTILTSSTGGLTPMAIASQGTDAQRRKYLPALTQGQSRTAFALTEPETGSDAAALRTRADRHEHGWVLNGQKQFISNADVANVILVIAVTDKELGARGGFSAFLVDRDTPGMTITRVDTTMGSPAWTLSEITFDNCVVGADAVLGQIGSGFQLASGALTEGRMSVASTCLGAAERLLEMAIVHAKTRRTFGVPLAERQAIQWMIADSATELAAARALVQQTLASPLTGKAARASASMCKLLCSETAGRVADRTVQIHGATGVVTGFPVERFYRDLRLFRVGEGSSEMQRLVISRSLLAA